MRLRPNIPMPKIKQQHKADHRTAPKSSVPGLERAGELLPSGLNEGPHPANCVPTTNNVDSLPPVPYQRSPVGISTQPTGDGWPALPFR
jgi:hypothetical protein